MDDKYIDLLLNICIKKNTKILFINYNKVISSFVSKLKDKSLSLGIEEIYEDIEDMYEIHELLKNLSLEEIEQNPKFNQSIWDEYAKKDASFIILETEMPHLMDDIEEEKITKMARTRRNSRPIYRKLQNECKLSWNISAYPSVEWSKEIYKNSSNSYDLLKEAIYKVCMVDKDNPVDSWNELIEKNNKIIKYLNNLEIEKLHYTNSLGTDLYIYLPDKYLYAGALENNVMVNMPSYEIFTSPIYNETEGIVYASMPLMYNGNLVEDFNIRFEKGKVVEINASKGKEILEGIINTDDYSSYLGECALVESNSPIASLNTIFKTTLIDENASCHLALGAAFPECIENGLNMKEKELREKGINNSKTHVDFMIGTKDLNIEATLKDKRKIMIFEHGNFSNDILNNIK